jgi:glutaminyl-peptide cyclotransferase
VTIYLFLLGLAGFGAFSQALEGPPVPTYHVQIVHVYPHDREAFTQGLEYRDGVLYEGTGLKGHSTVRKEDLQSGRVVQKIAIADQYFGEGITVLPKSIVELTWQSHTGFVYDRSSLGFSKSFSYSGEGWGLANDGQHIYMSDGTAQIRVLDLQTLAEQRRITVHEGSKEFDSLNELEYVRGEIFANVWQTDQILRISPRDGAVAGVIDLSGLLSQTEREEGADVLNGIAYDSASDRLFITGKLWPKLFEIRLVPTE